MSRRYFGTDGIRGRVGESPITPDFMLRLGWACGRVFAHSAGNSGGNSFGNGRGNDRGDGRCAVVIGKDTRVSGYMLESALEAGLVAAGADVKLLGPMPTPAVALITRTQGARAGIVISASHNPYYDNGVKFFSGGGHKLDDALELAIEEQLEQPLETVDSAAIGKAVRVVDAAGVYIEHCKSTVPESFSLRGLKIVVDCAHGATYHVAPSVFAELGADVVAMGVEPDGFNINQGVGSTDTAALAARVAQEGADMGIALDGDGDRVIFVDRGGAVIDGDELLFIIARHRRCEGVVGTEMTNLGAEIALREQGIGFARAPVGDRYVYELMREKGWPLGGESSGHIICAELAGTGDGIVAALQVLDAVQSAGEDLETLRGRMKKYPQHTINVDAPPRVDLSARPAIAAAVAEAEAALGDTGRVVLRPSGTQPVVRVTLEGEDPARVEALCRELADTVDSTLRSG